MEAERKEPQVEVLLIARNEESLIRRAIDSILAQDYPNLRVTLVDDASSDATPTIMVQYAQDDPRVRVFINSRPLGLAASKNTYLARTTGEYVAYQDGDDFSMPDRLKKQVAFMSQFPGLDGCFTDILLEVNSGVEYIRGGPLSVSDLFMGNPVAHPTALLRGSFARAASTRYRALFRHTEDYELWSRVVFTSRLEVLHEPLYVLNYAQPASASNSARAPFRRELEILSIKGLLTARYMRSRGRFQPEVLRSAAKGIFGTSRYALRLGCNRLVGRVRRGNS